MLQSQTSGKSKPNTLVIMGDRCANCGRYFSLWHFGPTHKDDTPLRHMCPPRTRKVPESFTDDYKSDYLVYLLEMDEFKLMWGHPKLQSHLWAKADLF